MRKLSRKERVAVLEQRIPANLRKALKTTEDPGSLIYGVNVAHLCGGTAPDGYGFSHAECEIAVNNLIRKGKLRVAVSIMSSPRLLPFVKNFRRVCS